MKEITICPHCHGSGLEPCPLKQACHAKHKCNNNVLAKEYSKYVKCSKCKGEGRG